MMLSESRQYLLMEDDQYVGTSPLADSKGPGGGGRSSYTHHQSDHHLAPGPDHHDHDGGVACGGRDNVACSGRDSDVINVVASQSTSSPTSPVCGRRRPHGGGGATEAVDILRRKDTHGLSRVMTLPLRQSVTSTRDPFPELAGSPIMTLTVSHVLMDTSARSTPSSSPPRLVLSRSHPVSRSGSGYDLSSGSRSLSGYDVHGETKLLSINGPECDGYQEGVHEILSADREGLDEADIAGHTWTPSTYKNQLLFFYTDDENYRSLVVDSSMLVCDVCRKLVEKNHVKEDINWTIVEYNLQLNLERILEDHENIHAITRHWQDPNHFRLYFRKDCRKFEPFKNPANFISPDLIDHGQLNDTDISDLLPSADRYNHILLQHLFNVEKLPDIQGHCLYKDSKKSWKKLFCVLKSAGLFYSTKGKVKDAKHLTNTCDLSEVNIYSVLDSKRCYGAPTSTCLCLKRPQASDVKEMVFLCLEDDRSLLCWYTALRLVKFKSQLREDYKTAVNVLERSTLKENSILTVDNGQIHERVAMDFTGTRGRVVEDPCEAFGVACEEAHQWRKKVTCRKIGHDSDIAPPAFLSNSTVPEQCTQGLGAGVHMAQPWFHSGISRQEAVDLITKQGVIDGVFLVRESQSINGVHVLSLAHNHKVKHCQIHKVETDGHVYHTLDGGNTKFTDLLQLVEFYQVNAAGLPTRLTHYVTCLA